MKLKILVTSDHTTSCRAKRHTDKPVPVIFYDFAVKKNEKNRFTEFFGVKGKKYVAKNLLKETIYS